jgi:hypothetical protein
MRSGFIADLAEVGSSACPAAVTTWLSGFELDCMTIHATGTEEPLLLERRHDQRVFGHSM